jgi:hypothetical protein
LPRQPVSQLLTRPQFRNHYLAIVPKHFGQI